MLIWPINEEAKNRALKLLEQGEVVALPTETVYGLGARASCQQAIKKIYKIKGRPSFNPLIAHVGSVDMADQYAKIDSLSELLIENFWPGPLTLVLEYKHAKPIHTLARAGLDTIALRYPVGVIKDLSLALDEAIVAPSANRSGFLSPTTAAAVSDDIGSKLPLILDGGASKVGVESTIIKVVNNELFLLRAGGLAPELIEAVTGKKLNSMQLAAAIEAPGMLASHYSPESALIINAESVNEGNLLLCFGKTRITGANKAKFSLNLSPSGNLEEAASNLFNYLHILDNLAEGGLIMVEPIPRYGLGLAINDRLLRAAAPKI